MSTNRRRFLKGSAALAAGAAVVSTAAAKDEAPSPPFKFGRTRFAVNLEMWWSKLPFIRRIEEAARLGFTAIEFWPWQGKDIKAVGETCRRLKIEVAQFSAWGFTPGLNDPKNHTRFLEDVERSCEVAHQLDCRLLCVVGGNDIAGVS